MLSHRTTPGCRQALRLIIACLLAVTGVGLGTSSAMAGHGDGPNRDRDNNYQVYHYRNLAEAGRIACSWGQARLETNTEINTVAGNWQDIICFDGNYNKWWLGFSACSTAHADGSCDVYFLRYDWDYGSAPNAYGAGWYRYIGCHEFGHTSSIGHRSVDGDDNSCMTDGSRNMYFDGHDNRAINADYP